jgi:hypothetical protein
VLAVALACGEAAGGGTSAGGPDPGGPTGPTGSTGPVILERLDQHPECNGLVPDHAPDAVEVRWEAPPRSPCGGGTSDGTGHVAVAAREGAGAGWQVFGPDGMARGTFAAWPLLAAPSGWHGLAVEPRADLGTRVTHRTYAPAGALLREADASSAPDQLRAEAWALAVDPEGGSFTLVGQLDLFRNHWTRLEAQRFDETGRPRWSETVAFAANDEHEILFVAGGVSTRGEALAIRQNASRVDVTWLRADGTTAAQALEAEPFAAVVGSADHRRYEVDLVPLLDGGLAVRADGIFRRVYPHLATESAPLPAWLAQRATSGLRFTRGARGYALFPPAGQEAPRCDQALDVLAPSGRHCGRVILAGEGRACTTGVLDQGWDGTVVQQREQYACAWRFWPRLLAR